MFDYCAEAGYVLGIKIGNVEDHKKKIRVR
jgi:hypothetical protein